MGRSDLLTAFIMGSAAVWVASPAYAQTRTFDVPAGDLAKALKSYIRQSGVQLIYRVDDLRGKTTRGAKGAMTPHAALDEILAGTGIAATRDPSGAVMLGKSESGAEAEPERTEILVTGSRIPGAQGASPVIVHRTDKARDEGVTDMHALAATIPQNFNGGQNPGVGSGGEGFGNLVGDTSTALNLRGLGPDATLTLLNGHRLAYNENLQAIDFSSIPFAAVDRVEVMPDGASAIYGSDAVGGVVNVILKRDYEGVTANAVVGAATEGGYFNQDYSLVGGTTWKSGGLVLTGNFSRSTEVTTAQRSFTSSSNPDRTLYPATRFYGFVGSGHQDLTQDLRFELDALYSHRNGRLVAPWTAIEPATEYGLVNESTNWSTTVSPTLSLDLSPWTVSLNGVYAKASSLLGQLIYLPGSPPSASPAKYVNQTKAVELGGQGPLVSLPAGDVRLAVGVGYRVAELNAENRLYEVEGRQRDRYAYAELGLPLVSPEQQVSGIYRLSFDAAFRYEDYPGIDRVGTPKLGVVYSPTADFDLKASWGKSFKAPTLTQLYFPVSAILMPADLYGSRDAPADQTFLYLSGGNPDLLPERAESWSATLGIHPRSIPRFDLQLTWFRANYQNRISNPITSLIAAFDDPAFASAVLFDPDVSAQSAAIALSANGIDNQTITGAPYDPSKVIALMDDRNQNISGQMFQGVDVTASYAALTPSAGTFNLHASASYIDSNQSLLPGSPSVDLAGTIFRPAHVRARGGVTWSIASTTVSATANYVGGVKDARYTPVTHIRSMTTIDLSIKQHVGDPDGGVDVQLSGLNLFNAKPEVIRTVDQLNQSFDFTNYSGIGRYLSFSLTKVW